MPSKKSIFTPLSILFRPHQKPILPVDRFLVEAPGTEPYKDKFAVSRRKFLIKSVSYVGSSWTNWRLGGSGGFCCQVPPNPA